jgi:hypothetical protein
MEHRSGAVGGDLLLVAEATIDRRTDRFLANRLQPPRRPGPKTPQRKDEARWRSATRLRFTLRAPRCSRPTSTDGDEALIESVLGATGTYPFHAKLDRLFSVES